MPLAKGVGETLAECVRPFKCGKGLDVDPRRIVGVIAWPQLPAVRLTGIVVDHVDAVGGWPTHRADEMADPHPQSGLLAQFTHNGISGGLPGLDPTSRKRPCAATWVAAPSHQQEPPVAVIGDPTNARDKWG